MTAAPPVGIFYGWIVAFAAFGVLSLAYSLQFSYGIFMPAMAAELGWSRTALSAPFALYVLVYSMLSVFTGPLTDRYGPRRVITIGAAILILGYLLVATVQSQWQLYLYFGIVTAVGMSVIFVPANATVVRWFDRRRGLAVGLASSGGNFANLLGPPAAALLIPLLGWRQTLVIMTCFCGLCLIIVAQALRRDPEAMGLRPDGDTSDIEAASDSPMSRVGSSKTLDMTVRQAMATATFWVILCIYALSWTVLFFPYLHLPAYAMDSGQPAIIGASLLGILGIGSMVGRIFTGPLSDRYGRLSGLILALGSQAVAFTAFPFIDGALALVFVTALLGLGSGASVSMFPALIADRFGRRHVGAIAGMLFATAGSFAAVGPLAGGVIQDFLGSYDLAFLLAGGFNFAALLLTPLLRMPKTAGS